ncbi:Uncharacterised protein [Mycobacterium tuberculosis]|nr:Uncharacterised protein [Mycobacterium tuberculosis]
MPMNSPPAAEAVSPSGVTPPDVPGSTVRRLTMDLGVVRLTPPISVAQVSAVTAAITPIKAAHQAGCGINQ